MTNQAPPRGAQAQAAMGAPPDARNGVMQEPKANPEPESNPDEPGVQPGQQNAARYPTARVLVEPAPGETVTFTSTGPQSFRAGVYRLEGDVVITYGQRTVQADRIEYDSNSGEVTATGHLVIADGANQEHITASHGTYNLKLATGRFYDVSGSVGLRPKARGSRLIYTNTNPFLFNGRMVVKTGAQAYDVYDGNVTSCLLPKPDWILSSAHLSIAGEKATARNSTFRLLNLPILFLPYVTHSIDQHARQSGFLVPTIGESSVRGLIVGEQIYMTLGRSADLTVGAEYYSLRGFAQSATFRYRGSGLNFVDAHYSGLLDRRSASANQGGEDIVAAGRHDFSPATRVAGNIEYLSSYVYREAFTNNFNQAITSDVLSTLYAVHHFDGIELGALADRYQGIKLIAQGTTPQQQVHIFHAPSLSVETTEHRLPTGLEVSLESSAAGLKRTQPGFVTGGIVERLDVHPRAAYDLDLGGWRVRPGVGARETLYNRSLVPNELDTAPRESLSGLIRPEFEASLAVRPPVLSRTFAPRRFNRILGTELRHTLAPEVTYRLTKGVSNFDQVLRFDAVDVASNTDEIEYGVTQRLYRKAAHRGACEDVNDEPGLNPAASEGLDSGQETFELPVAEDVRAASHGCTEDEVLSWRLTQKYFFDPGFGGAVVNSRRNIFTSTLDLSGVAFLTEPRKISPLISRMRLRSSAHTDLEWDFDLDTGAGRFNSSNVYLDLHQGNLFGALSYARLDAPGRFYTQSIQNSAVGVSSAVSNFEQLRMLLGYGNPAKKGLSIAGNTGLDLKSFTGAGNSSPAGQPKSIFPALLQYLAVQTSYNWNCCGVAFEYREFELGSVRNVPGYRFSFSLANVGTAGNLRRAERLF